MPAGEGEEELFATPEELTHASGVLERASRRLEEREQTLERKLEARTRELAEVEERYRTLVEHVPSVEYATHVEEEGRSIYVSPRSHAILGLQASELIGDSEAYNRHIHEHDRKHVLEEKARRRETGQAMSMEYRLLAADGRERWVRDEATPVKDATGVVRGYHGVLLDISELKRAEQRLNVQYMATQILAESPGLHDAMSRLLEVVGVGLGWDVGEIWEFDDSTGVLRSTATWCVDGFDGASFLEETGRSTFAPGRGLVGRCWQSSVPQFAAELGREPSFLRGQAAARIGLRAGLVFPIRGSAGVLGVLGLFRRRPAVPDHGMVHLLTALGSQLGQFIERKRAEATTREKERLFQSILDSTPAVIYVSDLQGRLILGNRALERVMRRPLSESLGRTAHDVFPAPNAERLHAANMAVVGSREPNEIEEVVETSDGPRTMQSLKFPLLDSTGTPYAVCGISTDVTDQKRSREELERQRRVLAQTEKLAAMGELLAGVAHELNNPLSVIVGQAHLLKRVAEGSAAKRAEQITRAADRCARIIRNLLALARQRPMERQPISLNQVVAEAIELVSYPLCVDSVEVVSELAPDLPMLWADPHQLGQVVVNLLTNAHHALRAREERRVVIRTRRAPAGGGAVLEVEDSGGGIAEEVRERLFEPFFTTKPAGTGTGLGLPLCKGIVEAHGGTISAESEPGCGALFRVVIPEGSHETPPAAEVVVSPPQRRTSGARILVVEDEEALRELLSETLTGEGYDVKTAADGSQALAVLSGGGVDLILSDIRMPRLDGPELYRAAKTLQPSLGERFVFLTGDSFGAETREFLESAARPTLEKPFALDAAREAIERCLQGLQTTS